jgi:ABC-type Zn2+ transport system substrate-binding protein/surface adhesin
MDSTGGGRFILFNKKTLARIDAQDHHAKTEKGSKADVEEGTTKGHEHEHEHERERDHDDVETDKTLESGKKLPPRFSDYFPLELAGRPLEEFDPYYEHRKVNQILFCYIL